MKGSMVKCLKCNMVSVHVTDHGDRDRCPVCKGYSIPQGECNIVDENKAVLHFFADGKLIQDIYAADNEA